MVGLFLSLYMHRIILLAFVFDPLSNDLLLFLLLLFVLCVEVFDEVQIHSQTLPNKSIASASYKNVASLNDP